MEGAYWDALFASFKDPESYFKLLFLLVTAPLWWPILRAMWEEVNAALAPEGGLFGRSRVSEVVPPPPGMDPFVNLPRTRRGGRSRSAPSSTPVRRPGGAGAAGGSVRSVRSGGFRPGRS